LPIVRPASDGASGKLAAGNPATAESALKRYDIARTVFAPDAGIVATLDRKPGWRRLTADAYEVVYARDERAPQAKGGRVKARDLEFLGKASEFGRRNLGIVWKTLGFSLHFLRFPFPNRAFSKGCADP
jgi:hypothetical protein